MVLSDESEGVCGEPRLEGQTVPNQTSTEHNHCIASWEGGGVVVVCKLTVALSKLRNVERLVHGR